MSITIDPPDGATVLAARHLDATEGRVQVGSTVDAATRAAITCVLDYIARAHNSPSAPTEQQLGRAENALERLRLAREALIRDGYFTADEVGPDIAPRIVEWLSHHRGLVEELNAELARLRAGEESGWDPMVVPTPGQWIARWNSLGPAQRLDRAKAVIETAETANRCHSEGHALKLEEGRKNWLKLNGGREEVPSGKALIYCKALSAYVGHGQMPDGRFVLMRVPEGML